MATISEEVIRDGNGGGTRILKFEALDCVGGDQTSVIDCAGYRYAVFCAKKNAGSGTGTGALQIFAYNSDAAANMPIAGFDSGTTDGAVDTVSDVMLTSNASFVGTGIDYLPAQIVLVHDGGNGGTLTMDLYVELHR
jgi:hypothetical protein